MAFTAKVGSMADGRSREGGMLYQKCSIINQPLMPGAHRHQPLTQHLVPLDSVSLSWPVKVPLAMPGYSQNRCKLPQITPYSIQHPILN